MNLLKNLKKNQEKFKNKQGEKMEYIYGALLLHKLGKEVSEENLKKVISATGAEADESKIKVLVTSLKDVNIEEQLASASIAAPASASEKEESAEEEKKEEPKAEAAEGLASLFG
jgi:large subunit ribosomal protein L12